MKIFVVLGLLSFLPFFGLLHNEKVEEEQTAEVAKEALLVPEEVSVQSLASEFRRILDETNHLLIKEEQFVAYLRLPLCDQNPKPSFYDASDAIDHMLTENPGNVVVVESVVEAEMFPNRFTATFWKKGDEEPLSKLELHPPTDNEPAVFSETHRYPLLGYAVRQDRYPAHHLYGVNDLSLPFPLYEGIPGCCAHGSMTQTWVGGVPLAESMERVISEGVLEAKGIFEGQEAYRVVRVPYVITEDDERSSSVHTFLFDAETGLLLGWLQERVHIVYGRRASYMYIKEVYSYEFPEEEKPDAIVTVFN
jgi:hypothetical protein